MSARTVLVSALNFLEKLDDALILEPACPAFGPLNHAASADIERAFDDSKGALFLAREVLAAFQGRGGVVCFVSGGTAVGPVESAVHEAFRGMAASILAAPGGTTIVANGFQCGAVDPEEYAGAHRSYPGRKGAKDNGTLVFLPGPRRLPPGSLQNIIESMNRAWNSGLPPSSTNRALAAALCAARHWSRESRTMTAPRSAALPTT